MRRPFQFVVAAVLLAIIVGCAGAGWHAGGWVGASGCAMTAFWSLATILAVANVRQARRELAAGTAVLVEATRKHELPMLPLHLTEAALVTAPSLFFILGETLLEMAAGIVLLPYVFLKVFVFVRACSTLPPR